MSRIFTAVSRYLKGQSEDHLELASCGTFCGLRQPCSYAHRTVNLDKGISFTGSPLSMTYMFPLPPTDLSRRGTRQVVSQRHGRMMERLGWRQPWWRTDKLYLRRSLIPTPPYTGSKPHSALTRQQRRSTSAPSLVHKRASPLMAERRMVPAQGLRSQSTGRRTSPMDRHTMSPRRILCRPCLTRKSLILRHMQMRCTTCRATSWIPLHSHRTAV